MTSVAVIGTGFGGIAERLRTAGGAVELEVLPGVWHDVHLLGHLLPEAAEPLDRIGRWPAERMAAAPESA